MSQFLNAIDGLPKIAKILLALPFLDIVWVIYRLCKSLDKKNTLGIVLGIVLIIVGIPFLWLVDMITLALKDSVIWLD